MSEQHQKSNNSLLIIILVIFFVLLTIIAALVFGGWYYFQNKLKSLADVQPSPTITVTFTPSAAPPTAAITPTPTNSSALKTGVMPTNNYVIPESNTREIAEIEIIHLTPWQLKVARNEIYARHGRPFVHKDLQCYFAAQTWYQVDYNFTASMLSEIENKNIATIKAYEEKINSPLKSFDSGC